MIPDKTYGLPVLLIALGGITACGTSQSSETPRSAQGAHSQPMAYGGGDGTSCDQAVVIKEDDEISGIMAEYSWLAARYPGYAKRYQATGRCSDHSVDKLGIRTEDGRDLEVVFDISGFFGSPKKATAKPSE